MSNMIYFRDGYADRSHHNLNRMTYFIFEESLEDEAQDLWGEISGNETVGQTVRIYRYDTHVTDAEVTSVERMVTGNIKVTLATQ